MAGRRGSISRDLLVLVTSSARPVRRVAINIGVFVLAAFFEIAGCFAFWMSLRRGATLLMAVLGVVSLIVFGFALNATGANCVNDSLVRAAMLPRG